MKTILNNILNANSWLFLELVIITVVAWAVFEPAVVNLYYRSLPLGYDSGQLLFAETEVNGSWDELVDGVPQDPYEMTQERQEKILRQLMTVEGVESVYPYNNDYGSLGYSQIAYNGCCVDGDTLLLANINFNSDARFFETYGLKPLLGSPSAEELSHLTNQDQQVVLTRSGAIALFGTADVVGRRFTICYDPAYEVTVAGVVEDFRKALPFNQRSIILKPGTLRTTQCLFVLRLREGIDARRFVEEHGRDFIRSGKTNFARISTLMTYDDRLQQQELDDGRPQEVNRSLALAFFFLVNLCLAVIGTVWLHAKRRTEECGVRRAFGATRRRLFCEMLLQNAALATAAVLIGLIIYLNYAYSGITTTEDGITAFETLYMPMFYDLATDKTWPDHFWSHFLVISACVYLIILCTVIIGTAIPAWKITRTKVTDALREE
jgi:hypothetical protein